MPWLKSNKTSLCRTPFGMVGHLVSRVQLCWYSLNLPALTSIIQSWIYTVVVSLCSFFLFCVSTIDVQIIGVQVCSFVSVWGSGVGGYIILNCKWVRRRVPPFLFLTLVFLYFLHGIVLLFRGSYVGTQGPLSPVLTFCFFRECALDSSLPQLSPISQSLKNIYICTGSMFNLAALFSSFFLLFFWTTIIINAGPEHHGRHSE